MKIQGKAIRERMKEIGMTQDVLAERLGLSQGHISDVITGKKDASVGVLVGSVSV